MTTRRGFLKMLAGAPAAPLVAALPVAPVAVGGWVTYLPNVIEPAMTATEVERRVKEHLETSVDFMARYREEFIRTFESNQALLREMVTK